MDKDKLKEEVKEAAAKAQEVGDAAYDTLLEKIAGDRKPSVGRSRIFVFGAVAGVLITLALQFIC